MDNGQLTGGLECPSAESYGDDMDVSSLKSALLCWYRAAKRELPFRLTRDPYAIWVSEIMAQQTRITALLPYFHAFMKRFPTVRDLAAAQDSEVLKLWEGLGYYSRARHLHAAAKVVCDRYGGQLPAGRDDLLALPGIGAYTAGAILSIAFGQKAAAVDGNVVRVYARLTLCEHPVGTPELQARAETFCLALMPADAPGDMTEALMELGALICLPRMPKCAACPAQALCRAHSDGVETAYPHRLPKKEKRVEKRPVWLILDEQNRILMRKRTQALLRGLWEFPDTLPEVFHVLAGRSCGDCVHLFTHIRWEMSGHLVFVKNAPAPGEFVWVEEKLDTLAIPTAFRKYAQTVEETRGFSARQRIQGIP